MHIMSIKLKDKPFMSGTAYSALTIALALCSVTIASAAAAACAETTANDTSISSPIQPAVFNQFPLASHIYEPSGIHQLTDGRVIIAEDEAHRPFSLLAFHPNGSIAATPLLASKIYKKKEPFKQLLKLDDLEGIDTDNKGHIYATTSHSKTKRGGYSKKRDKLVRFSISDGQITEPIVITGLREELISQFPALNQKTAGNGFNIESISLNREQDQLLIGFRTPLSKEGNAFIAVIDNLAPLFTGDTSLQFAPNLIQLNLNGDAIRGMAYDPHLQGYLIIAGPAQKGKTKENQLWFWKGSGKFAPKRLTIKGLDNIKNGEGVAPIMLNGQKKIMIISDDGKEKTATPASYLLINYDQLTAEGKPLRLF